MSTPIHRLPPAAFALLAIHATGPHDIAMAGDIAGLINIGDGRSIYLACRGEGAPTVVLISGGWEAGWIWAYALTPDDPVHVLPYDAFSNGGGKPQKLDTAIYPAVAKFAQALLPEQAGCHDSRTTCSASPRIGACGLEGV
jgi:hypothetical protein